jgi:rare lipoprotein A
MAGRPLASGAPYDPAALTASHRTLPLGTVVLVTNPSRGRSTFVTIADRGPVSQSYLLELSEAAAEVLDLDPNAARRVELHLLP